MENVDWWFIGELIGGLIVGLIFGVCLGRLFLWFYNAGYDDAMREAYEGEYGEPDDNI